MATTVQVTPFEPMTVYDAPGTLLSQMFEDELISIQQEIDDANKQLYALRLAQERLKRTKYSVLQELERTGNKPEEEG